MKKLLIALPMLALLAAGCGSSSQQPPPQSLPAQTQNQPTGQTPADGQQSAAPTGVELWTGVLQKSDDSSKGSLMLITSGHKVYLRTSRDYSALIGKDVSVSYQGNMDSFILNDITAPQ